MDIGYDAEVTTTHDERYRVVEEPAMRRVELRVIGSDYGATGYTTRSQADRMAALLDLGPGKLLLDVGSGAGWPGIHLAATTGARVVLTDIPFEGLGVAVRRISREGVDAHVVAASGHRMPFADGSFHAVTSSDVLCCVPDKGAVLWESRRLLRPGGRICFTVIAVADGLDAAEAEQAVAHGPPYVEAGPGYPALLAAAGFAGIEVHDASTEFLATSGAWVGEWEAEATDLRPLLGEEAFDERQATRSQANEIIAAGLLRRHIVTAERR